MTCHTLLLPLTELCSPDTVAVVPVDLPQQVQTVLITLPGRRDVIMFSKVEKEIAFYEGWCTDSHAACVRLSEQRELSAGFFINGSGFTLDGRDLLRVERRIGFGAVLVQPDQTYIELSEPVEVSTTLPNPRIIIATTSEGMHTQCARHSTPKS